MPLFDLLMGTTYLTIRDARVDLTESTDDRALILDSNKLISHDVYCMSW